ncbi:MAG TPA: glycosyltransferase, partial [bacterium]|nr:glycosyltransferase [bacterium]
PHPFSQTDLSGKEKNKKFLLEQTHLTYDPAKPVIGIVSRLVGQKGFDLIEKALPELMLLDAQWVILGSGEDRYEDMFENLHHALPYKVWTYIGYSNELAHRIEAGADIFLMPSHFEPCGLNQMYSQRYGTIPVVRKTGGLADTVWDWHELHSAGRGIGNGFTFTDASPYALFTTLLRALETYKDKTVWRKIQQNAMAMDHSWDASAQRYIELYKMAIQKRRAE